MPLFFSKLLTSNSAHLVDLEWHQGALPDVIKKQCTALCVKAFNSNLDEYPEYVDEYKRTLNKDPNKFGEDLAGRIINGVEAGRLVLLTAKIEGVIVGVVSVNPLMLVRNNSFFERHVLITGAAAHLGDGKGSQRAHFGIGRLMGEAVDKRFAGTADYIVWNTNKGNSGNREAYKKVAMEMPEGMNNCNEFPELFVGYQRKLPQLL